MNKKENEVVFTGKIVEVSESEKLYNIKLYIHVFLMLYSILYSILIPTRLSFIDMLISPNRMHVAFIDLSPYRF